MNLQPELSSATVECSQPHLWQRFDVMSAEVEVLEFMAQLVRTIKPLLVVETGTYRGLAAFYIGRALAENRRGRLVTFEISRELHRASTGLIRRGGLTGTVDCRLESSLGAEIRDEIDLLFTDSEKSLRLREIEHWWERLSPGSLIVVHDVNSGEHNDLRQQLLAEDLQGRLSVLFLPTPRGLALCQKRQARH